ncbi:MAG: hypothetical protein QMD97_00565 [Candidatus Aenigmarchaeota archaeon]|nr:hypothetical protein [Candidatus Aenigmarchaeota archaeon]
MNPVDILSANTYRTGNIVQADKEAISRALLRGEETLGFGHRDYKFEIITIPKDLG